MTESKGRILIVDDDRAMCDVLATGLASFGFEVETTTSPVDALETLGAGDFDALITDLSMGPMSGLDLCTRALAMQPGLPVVVITAFGSLEGAIGAIRAGAYDFLPKPFDIEEAVDQVRPAADTTTTSGG